MLDFLVSRCFLSAFASRRRRPMRRILPASLVHSAVATIAVRRSSYWSPEGRRRRSTIMTTDVWTATDSQCDVERPSRCSGQPMQQCLEDDRSLTDNHDLYTCERIVVMFIQLKNYLGSYWLAPWFFVYIYPSILVYEWVFTQSLSYL